MNLLTPGQYIITIFNVRKVKGKRNKKKVNLGGGGRSTFVITVGKSLSILIHEYEV